MLLQYQRVAALAPGSPDAHNNVGNLLALLGRFDEATRSYERALALRPQFAEVHNNLANVLKQQGHFDRAVQRYQQAIALQPDYADAHFNQSEIKTFQRDDQELPLLEALARDNSTVPAGKKPLVHFALGKALEDAGEYDRAFGHWLQGNALKRRQLAYDPQQPQQDLRQIVDVFDRQFFQRFAAAGDPTVAPIFILGMPRSGTTLVEQILASHPQVHGAGEHTALERLARRLPLSTGRLERYPAYLSHLDAAGLRRLGQAYLASLPALPTGKSRLTDKTTANFWYVGLIRLIFPGARVIHTVRDPVDTCLSCFSKLFTSGQAFTYDLGELGRYYRCYSELMDHWRTVLPAGAMLDVRYEEVVENLEQQVRRLLEFCGLSWDDRCLSFHQTARTVATASTVQVRRPLYDSSVGRWRRYEKHLGPLLAELSGLVRSP